MKQRITVEQLQELTPEQRARLREWWEPQEYDVYVDETCNGELSIYGILRWVDYPEIEARKKGKRLPLLSVGQCIELLKEIGMNKLVHLDHIGAIQDDDFIDALWQAVKEVL